MSPAGWPPQQPPAEKMGQQWLPASPMMAPPPAAIHVTVAAAVATPTEAAATYTAQFSAGGVALGAWPPVRFSALNKAHSSLPYGACIYPEFPSLCIFSNMKTDMDNVTRRGGEARARAQAYTNES